MVSSRSESNFRLNLIKNQIRPSSSLKFDFFSPQFAFRSWENHVFRIQHKILHYKASRKQAKTCFLEQVDYWLIFCGKYSKVQINQSRPLVSVKFSGGHFVCLRWSWQSSRFGDDGGGYCDQPARSAHVHLVTSSWDDQSPKCYFRLFNFNRFPLIFWNIARRSMRRSSFHVWNFGTSFSFFQRLALSPLRMTLFCFERNRQAEKHFCDVSVAATRHLMCYAIISKLAPCYFPFPVFRISVSFVLYICYWARTVFF